MNINKEKNELVLRIPLWQKDYDAIGEYIGDVPNLVGVSNGKDFSINYLCALGYKDDIQLGCQVVSFNDKKELEEVCKKLGLDIWEYSRCVNCDKTLYGCFTLDKKGRNVCMDCGDLKYEKNKSNNK